MYHGDHSQNFECLHFITCNKNVLKQNEGAECFLVAAQSYSVERQYKCGAFPFTKKEKS